MQALQQNLPVAAPPTQPTTNKRSRTTTSYWYGISFSTLDTSHALVKLSGQWIRLHLQVPVMRIQCLRTDPTSNATDQETQNLLPMIHEIRK